MKTVIVNAPKIKKTGYGSYEITVESFDCKSFKMHTNDSQLYDVWGNEEEAAEMDIDISDATWIKNVLSRDEEVILVGEIKPLSGYRFEVEIELGEVRYIPSGERVLATERKRDLGHGEQTLVVFHDKVTEAWFHTIDLLE